MLAAKFDFATAFNPRQIGGLALWLDGADGGTLFQNQGGTTPVTAAGQPIFRWNDKSGNGRNATTPRAIYRLNLTSGGSGYTIAPTVTISDSGGGIGSGATATATISGGAVNGLTLTARGTQYTNPVVTITRDAGDGTGASALANAVATVFPTRALNPPGVIFQGAVFNTTTGPFHYMGLPATTIPNAHTVFSVFTRVESSMQAVIGSGLDTPSIGSAQGSRYPVFFFSDNILYTTSVSQGAFTTHQPRQGFSGEVVIAKAVRATGSVSTQINDMPSSAVTSGSGVTSPATGSWSAVGGDTASAADAPAGNQLFRPFRGTLHEVVVYDRALTADEQAAVTDYLRAKWSVIFGSRFNLDWKVVGSSAWPGYRWSIANTANSATVADTVSVPSGVYASAVRAVSVTNGGSGYTGGAIVALTGNATATATVVDGVVTAITVTDPGSDYASAPTVTITGISGGSNATAVATILPVASYYGGVLLPDGKVFCAPYNASEARIFDPSDGSVATTSANSFPGIAAYVGGVLLPNGRVFCVPFNATQARIYDPGNNSVATTPPGSFPASSAFFGGVLLPDGRIFCVPYNATQARTYNPTDDTFTTTAANSFPGNSAHAGGVLLADGRVFCVPYNSTQGRIYDPVTGSVTATAAVFPGNYWFLGGVLLPDGRIFCVPYGGTQAYLYNPDTNTVTTTAANSFPGGGSHFGGVLLPNGRVFCVPFASSRARIFDPSDNSVALTATGSFPGGNAYAGGVVMQDGRVFCVPRNATYARLYGGGGGFDANVSLSAYCNKI